MPAKYLVALDRSHLRIYRFSQQPGQFTPSIQPVDAFDLPEDGNPYDSNLETGKSFLEGKRRPPPPSEDVPVYAQDDREWRLVEHLVERISHFMEKNPDSTWNLAAQPGLRNQVIEAVPERLRLRLDQVFTKDLVNVPPVELREYFALH